VLPIGGLKEKTMAAHRAGIKTFLLPKENVKDLVELPQKVRDEMQIIPVEHMDEVLKIALARPVAKSSTPPLPPKNQRSGKRATPSA
jgi:ATP-dependent Lon protease